MLPPLKTEQEARTVIARGLGRAELEFVTSLTAPLWWLVRDVDKKLRVRNGSAFFLDAGEGPFGVTANHVIEGWEEDRNRGIAGALQMGLDLPIDLSGENAIIASDVPLDIATFQISAAHIVSIEKVVLTGFQSTWLPSPPEVDKGVYFSGFPSVGTNWLSRSEISFGTATGAGVASSISNTDVSSLIERKNLIAVLGDGIPPEDYDFRGMSGGPMLAVIETGSIQSWSLAGVVYEGPNPSADEAQAIAGLEIIMARRSHFILPNGQLDIRRWEDGSHV